jgi:LacI family repressor for deo operon, udp, cdd, tsx, nupC, and nupG
LAPLIEQGMAIVYVGSTSGGDKVPFVRCDDLDGGKQATRHLIDLGHSAIATITGPPNEECVQDRLNGYRQAMAEVGLERDPLPAVTGDWSAESGCEAAKQLLNMGRPFTAIFAQNDQMAIGIIRALREADYQVPADISVIGFDDIPLTSYFDPPLTTIRQPMEELGQRAAQLLVQVIESPNDLPEQVLVRGHLIERASCAPPKRL